MLTFKLSQSHLGDVPETLNRWVTHVMYVCVCGRVYVCTGRGTSSNPCSENYRGTHPFSEPEAKAMAELMWQLRERMVVYLSLHSYGQYWLTPWGYTVRVPTDFSDMVRYI